MNNTILQVPVNKELRDRASTAASKMGFSSLQESIRVFLKQLATGEIQVKFEPKAVRLSSENEARYLKMIDDIKTDKVKLKTFKDVDSLMEDLNSED